MKPDQGNAMMRRESTAAKLLVAVVFIACCNWPCCGIAAAEPSPALGAPVMFIGADAAKIEADHLQKVPEFVLSVEGHRIPPITVQAEPIRADQQFSLDLLAVGQRHGRIDALAARHCTFLYFTIDSEKQQTIPFGASADWWMAWYVNGARVYSTLEHGNGSAVYQPYAHVFGLPLRKGRNVIACKVLSGSHGYRLAYGLTNEQDAMLHEKMKQQRPNYDESRVPGYTLPPLMSFTGDAAKDRERWEQRRGEILRLFEDHVYGPIPDQPVTIEFIVAEEGDAFDGTARRRQIAIKLSGNGHTHQLDLLLFIPKSPGPVPCMLIPNFNGNHTVSSDPHVRVPDAWIKNRQKYGITDNRASVSMRGTSSSYHPQLILSKGYAFATIYYNQIEPDHPDERSKGIRPLFKEPEDLTDDWGAISSWAWGLMRTIDYLQADKDIDNQRIMVAGHSRLGKTALWTAANDDRVQSAFANNAGCGGDALFRRRFGERVDHIVAKYPHWFNTTFRQYQHEENQLPIDQHMLLALIAPRGVYAGSSSKDLWADPKGAFLSLKAAGPIFKLFGHDAMTGEDWPASNSPVVRGMSGYHVKEGEHSLTVYDWVQYLSFADRYFSAVSAGRDQRAE